MVEPSRQFITAYHTTSPENAEHLLKHGTTQPKVQKPATTVGSPAVAKMLGKNVGDPLDYEPGRGQGNGLYLSNRPGESQYGDVTLAVNLQQEHLMVPPERQKASWANKPDGPMRSLNIQDGYTEHPLSPSQFSLHPPKAAE